MTNFWQALTVCSPEVPSGTPIGPPRNRNLKFWDLVEPKIGQNGQKKWPFLGHFWPFLAHVRLFLA